MDTDTTATTWEDFFASSKKVEVSFMLQRSNIWVNIGEDETLVVGFRKVLLFAVRMQNALHWELYLLTGDESYIESILALGNTDSLPAADIIFRLLMVPTEYTTANLDVTLTDVLPKLTSDLGWMELARRLGYIESNDLQRLVTTDPMSAEAVVALLELHEKHLLTTDDIYVLQQRVLQGMPYLPVFEAIGVATSEQYQNVILQRNEIFAPYLLDVQRYLHDCLEAVTESTIPIIRSGIIQILHKNPSVDRQFVLCAGLSLPVLFTLAKCVHEAEALMGLSNDTMHMQTGRETMAQLLLPYLSDDTIKSILMQTAVFVVSRFAQPTITDTTTPVYICAYSPQKCVQEALTLLRSLTS